MDIGETRTFREPTVAAFDVTKYGKDEFRVCGDLPTSFPNSVRLLRRAGIEYADDWK
jgi:hypothetical protein